MKLVTKAQAATILGVTVRTIDNLINSGELPRPHRIGRRAYWLEEEFKEFLLHRLSHIANSAIETESERL